MLKCKRKSLKASLVKEQVVMCRIIVNIASYALLVSVTHALISMNKSDSSQTPESEKLEMNLARETAERENKSSSVPVATNTQRRIIMIPGAYFSPEIRDVVKAVISHEQEGIDGAQFRFNLVDVAKIWVARAAEVGRNGKKFTGHLVIDKDWVDKDTEKQTDTAALKLLIANGIPVYESQEINDRRSNRTNTDHQQMHHKFLIFHKNKGGRKLVITGSFNGTGKAAEDNWENILILDQEDVFNKFKAEYEKLVGSSHVLEQSILDKASSAVTDQTKLKNGHHSNETPTYFNLWEFEHRPNNGANTEVNFYDTTSTEQLMSQSLFFTLLKRPPKKIKGAFYRMGDISHANALTSTTSEMRIILDKNLFAKPRGDDLQAMYALLKKGCHFAIAQGYSEGGDMHHKFFIVEDFSFDPPQKKVIVGSGHPKKSSAGSWENLIETTDAYIVNAFEEEFERILKRSDEVSSLDKKVIDDTASAGTKKRAHESLLSYKFDEPRKKHVSTSSHDTSN